MKFNLSNTSNTMKKYRCLR